MRYALHESPRRAVRDVEAPQAYRLSLQGEYLIAARRLPHTVYNDMPTMKLSLRQGDLPFLEVLIRIKQGPRRRYLSVHPFSSQFWSDLRS